MQLASMKRSRTLVNLYFVYIGVLTFVIGLLMIRYSRNWVLSDWLINYEGGFVRRGLPGEFAFLVARALHISPTVFPPLFYLSVYFVLFWSMWVLALRSSMNIWIIALLVSPATLAFQILHPQAGFRKETVVIAALALFLMITTRRKVPPAFAIAYMTAFTVIGTFSHEGMFLYTPYLVAGLLLGGRSLAQATREFALPLVAGVAVFLICATHLGNAQTATGICNSLGYKLLVPGSNEICANGAIPYLRKGRAEAGAEALGIIKGSHYLEVFPGFIVLALIPAVGESLLLRRSGLRGEVQTLWTFAGLAFLCSSVLFRYGVDWGRWISAHVMCMTVLLLFIESKHAEEIRAASEMNRTPRGARQFLYAALVFFYATSWILPNAGEEIRMGYIGRFLYLSHFSSHGKDALPMPAGGPEGS